VNAVTNPQVLKPRSLLEMRKNCQSSTENTFRPTVFNYQKSFSVAQWLSYLPSDPRLEGSNLAKDDGF
jgi:hypothetical protein